MSPVNRSAIESFRAASDFNEFVPRGYFAFSYG
jgi:hypothetical protein